MTTSLETATAATLATTTRAATAHAATTASITLVATTRRLLVTDIILSSLLRVANRASITTGATFHDCLSKLAENQLHRAHCIIVGRDHDVGERRIAIGIENANDRDVHPLCFAHSVLFTTRIDHNQRTWQAMKVTDAVKIAPDALDLATNRRLVLLLVLLDAASRLQAFQLDKARQALANSRKVCQRSADPPLSNRRHLALLCFRFDYGTDLFLGPQEHDLCSSRRQRAHKVRCLVETADRFLEVNNVDLMPLSVDERFHLRVPTAGLVAIVDSGVDQFLRSNKRHVRQAPCLSKLGLRVGMKAEDCRDSLNSVKHRSDLQPTPFHS